MFRFNKKEEIDLVEDLKDYSLQLLCELAELKGYYGDKNNMLLHSLFSRNDLETVRNYYENGKLKAQSYEVGKTLSREETTKRLLKHRYHLVKCIKCGNIRLLNDAGLTDRIFKVVKDICRDRKLGR